MACRRAKILILCKTYPSPSANYVETSCVAAMEEDGRLLRLYPVPFRLLDDESQFKKWQWIEADIEKAKDDHRPESHRIRADTIRCVGKPLPTSGSWALRREQIELIESFATFNELDRARVERGVTLGLLPAGRILALDVTAAKHPDWTDDERQKLVHEQTQGNLFATPEASALRTLRKLPFNFHYRYCGATDPEGTENRHKIVDWEAGALYWNVVGRYGESWERPFRQKFEKALPACDLTFLMGTIHRFPDQWRSEEHTSELQSLRHLVCRL